MRNQWWQKLTLFVAALFLVGGAGAFEGASAASCKKACKVQKNDCFKPVKAESNVAKKACKDTQKADKAGCLATKKADTAQCKADKDEAVGLCEGDKICKKAVKPIFKQCKKDVKEADKACKSLAKETKNACMDTAKAAFDSGKAACANAQGACNTACVNGGQPPAAKCPPNLAGGPNLLTMTVVEGADLDAGWTGVGHNAGVVIGAQTFACLQDCDTDTNPVCTGTGPTGTGSLNKKTYGPPLPLLAADVATCVINEFTEDITVRKVNLQTGEVEMRVKLNSIVHLTGDKQHPCPICTGQNIGDVGKCQGLTNNQGKTCTVEGTTVNFGNTSSDCRPFVADNAGELDIVLDPITSGTAELLALESCSGGLCPCSGGGNPPKMNECDDPNSCSLQVCIDNGGSDDVRNGIQPGIDQACCKKQGEIIPCFIDDISRTGEAVPGQPLWPDPTYPKTAEGGKVAGVFCIPPTNSNTINQPTGLGGPGAFVLPGKAVVSYQE